MTGKRTILVLTIVALVIAILQKTPLAFLDKDAADFVWGAVAGLSIGTIVAWLASGRETP